MKMIIAISLLAVFVVNALAQTNNKLFTDNEVGFANTQTSNSPAKPLKSWKPYQKNTNSFFVAPSRDLIIVKPNEIVTRSGKFYYNVEISKIEPDAITFSYSNTNCIGVARISFSDLTDELQKGYGYDSKKAAEYEQQKAQLAAAYQAYQIQMQPERDKLNLEIAEQKYEDAKEANDDYLMQEQADAAQRSADAQERQADALEDQNFQQKMDSIDQDESQSETQQKLDDIDWDLEFGHRY